MNILELSEVALPDLPSQAAQRRSPETRSPRDFPRTHRARRACRVGQNARHRGLPPGSARCNGNCSNCSTANDRTNRFRDQILQQENVLFTEDDVREFASYLEEQGELFYKTPLEKNITLKQKMSSERHKRGRFHVADVTDITLHTWPDADDYLTSDQTIFRIYLHHLVHPAHALDVRSHGVDVDRQIRRDLERQFRLLQFHRENHLRT